MSEMVKLSREFRRKCEDKSIVVGILGLGYVGLPLAEAFTDVGIRVLGFDVDEAKVRSLTDGKTYIRHISDDRISEMISSNRFEATTDFTRLPEVDAILLCVPTPLNIHREPNLEFVVKTTETISQHLREGQLVVLESTTYPGTSDEVMVPILNRASGLESGKNYAVAYSPEREDPGNLFFSTTSIPKVVGANSDEERDMAVALYDTFTQTVPVSDLKTAEAVKLSENIFRLVNIALANELKFVFREMGIDAWEVVDAAKTKPFGYMPFYPGPGIGGHCIPIDPFYLTWKARSFGVATRFIDLAGDITASLPRAVVESVANALSERQQIALRGSKVLLVGIAYKKNLDDMRESPALPIYQQLTRRGAEVSYHDPLIPTVNDDHEHPELSGLSSIDLSAEALSEYDCALILTDHDGVDYELIAHHVPVILDTRNATAQLDESLTSNIIKA